jgi:hypothetical protein
MTLIPTMRLRWVRRFVAGPAPGEEIRYGDPPGTHEVKVLQQWFNNPSGAGFWYDVPVEQEEQRG